MFRDSSRDINRAHNFTATGGSVVTAGVDEEVGMTPEMEGDWIEPLSRSRLKNFKGLNIASTDTIPTTPGDKQENIPEEQHKNSKTNVQKEPMALDFFGGERKPLNQHICRF